MRAALIVAVVLASAMHAVAGDPAKTGALRVGVTTVEAVDHGRADRTLTTEVWYPAHTAGRDAEPLPRAFPLILLAHGFCDSRTDYDYVTTQLASRGFVVAAPNFPDLFTGNACIFSETATAQLPLDLSFLSATLHDTSGPFANIAVHVRAVATGLVGHSLGGYAIIKAAE